MSPFLDNVQLLKWVSADSSGGTRTAGEAAAAPAKAIQEVKHHSDNNDGVFAAIPITAIVFTFIYLIIKAIMAPFTQRARYGRQVSGGNGGGLTQEEVAVLQKLQRTLSQMESRVEALETILIDHARTEKNYGSKL